MHTFTGSITEGHKGGGSLALSGTTLYGYGQVDTLDGFNPATVFKLQTDGSGFGLVHVFSPDGPQFLQGRLVIAGGTLYGSSAVGGSGGTGTIFKLNTDGTEETILYNFRPDDAADGYDGADAGGLLLVGTTLYGAGENAAYSIQTDGSGFAVLHKFEAFSTTDTAKVGSLVSDGSGFYGIGGMGPNGTFETPNYYGAVFSIPAPEPGSAGLLACGCATLGLRRRR